MMERIPKPGEFYRHFKNKWYQIITVATHSETGEKLVIYQALYGDFGVYARPLSMFVSEVDHEKYPEVTQQWRFERVEPEQNAAGMGAGCGQAAVGNGQVAAGTGQVAGNRQDSRRYYADRTPDPAFLQFLDTEDFDLRMECLKALEERVTQQELDSIYLVLDMKPEQGSLQEQLYAVRRFLTMQKRYDGSRLR